MNLLATITSYPPATGGAQMYLHSLLRQISTTDDVTVVSQWDTNRTDWLLGTTLRAPSRPKQYEIDGIDVNRIGFTSIEKARISPYVAMYYFAMPYAVKQISDTFAAHLQPFAANSDIVHNVRIGRENLTFASQLVAREANIPFVFTPLHHPRWVGWRYKVYHDIYRSADAVIALTDAEKQTMIQLGVPEDRVHVTGLGPILYPDADPEHFVREHNIDGPMVLFLGQHYAYKGYRELLAAADSIWQTEPNTHFVFIGPPVKASERDYLQYQDRRIHRLGTVDLKTKTDALAACSVMCLPSTQESFGMVYVEAWSFSRPVVGCNIPAVADVVTDGVDGLLVQQNPNEIAEAIRTLLSDPALAARMGASGFAKATEQYSWDSLAAKTRDVYEAARA